MLLRPLYALAFAADNQGCGWHRIVNPLAALTALGLMEGRVEYVHTEVADIKAVAPDIIIYQRQIEDPQIEHMKKVRAALPNVHIVYDIDDLLSAIPEKNFHAGSVPKNVECQIARAISACDAVSTTTPILQKWLKSITDKPVHVIPNVLPAYKVRERVPHVGPRKVRVGWGGGMSHDGDLAIITHAMKEIGDAVEWVFIGNKPEGTPVKVEFHDAVPVEKYQDALFNLDLDLILAPLEQNAFNAAKSSLRLVEAGACSAAVIATPIAPYQENKPPVFAYCRTPADWTAAIRKFAARGMENQRKHGTAMREWVLKHYTYEGNLEARLRAWQPPSVETWTPSPAEKATGGVLHVSDPARLVETCWRARVAGQHVLWARPGVPVTESLTKRLLAGFSGDDPVVAVMPLASDGLNAFPQANAHTPLNHEMAETIDAAVAEVLTGKQLRLSMAFGPCVLLRWDALNLIGAPDMKGNGENVDAALMEWTARVAMRRTYSRQMADVYVASPVPPEPISENTQTRMRLRGYTDVANFPHEFLTDSDREDIELAVFKRQWKGLRPGVGNLSDDYVTWAALQRERRGIFNPYMVEHVKYGDKPSGLAKWVLWTEANTTLKPGTMEYLSKELAKQPDHIHVVYADHDMIDGDGDAIPFFKPDLDIRYLHGHDYITPVVAVKGSLTARCSRLEMFRVILTMAYDAPHRFAHLPVVLARVEAEGDRETRILEGKHYAAERAECINARGLGVTAEVHPQLGAFGMLQTTYQPLTGATVKIVIPTSGDPGLIQPCVNMILQHSSDVNFQIEVVATTEAEIDLPKDPRITISRWIKPEFNWAELNNHFGITCADFILFLNDDVVPAQKGWLSAMMANFREPDVGVVGARLTYPFGPVQHTGIIVQDGVVALHNRNLRADSPGFQGLAALPHEASGVTGACMMVRNFVWQTIKFDEEYPLNMADIDFCIKARKAGYRVVVETGANLHHRESHTRRLFPPKDGFEGAMREAKRFLGEHTGYIDPYWNPNFQLRPADGQLSGGVG